MNRKELLELTNKNKLPQETLEAIIKESISAVPSSLVKPVGFVSEWRTPMGAQSVSCGGFYKKPMRYD